MKRYLTFFLCLSLLLFPFQNQARANPAVLLLGGEGLGLLSGLAIKQGLRFAGAQAARVFFQSAVKRTPSMLGTLSSMTANGTRLNGAIKYTISGAAATSLMLGLADYAGEIENMPVGLDGLPILEYYDNWKGVGEYYGAENWYVQEYPPYYSAGIGYQTDGMNVHYLDPRDGVWKAEGLSTTNSLLGSHHVTTTAIDAVNTKVVISYQRPTGDIRTSERVFPFGGSVALDQPVVLRYPFPLDGVRVGEPRAIPIPQTGDFDIYIPFPSDTAYDVLEGNPTFVDTPIPGEGTTNPPTTDTNPPWTLPQTATINFAPLQIAGDQLTNKFPFSIPWDIKRQLSVFDVQPQTPKFDVNIKVPLFSTSFDMKFKVDFSIFDGLAVIVRWFLILAFDIGLILSLRRFFPE